MSLRGAAGQTYLVGEDIIDRIEGDPLHRFQGILNFLMVRMRRNLLQHEEYSILAQSMILLVSVSSVVSSRATRRIKVMQLAFR